MYKEYKQLNLSQIGKEVLENWKENDVFAKSINNRPDSKPYTFFEGPPSANGMPGIHHVMARSIKDIFCRYKTLKGYQVKRKGGWDTHGLPIELAVEKSLGITKEDIGKKISVEDYNEACRKEVMRYTDVWNDLTEKMGYWVDLDEPYITYKNDYIESLWWILKELHTAGFLYKGYTVQPYSPAAGTGLSSHELNQPGTYRDVKDTSVVAEFRLKGDQIHPLIPRLFEEDEEDTVIIAWTTTPWTLPSNCALAIGENIDYVKVKTFNQYTHLPVSVVLARDLVAKHFKAEAKDLSFQDYKGGDKLIPWEVTDEFKGSELVGLRYYQLLPYVSSEEIEANAFRVIPGDFVTTEDGTGIVHIASVYGADDFRVAKENGVPSIMIKDERGNELPLVDKQGRFIPEVTDFAGRFVKEEYYSDEERKAEDFKPTDVLIAIKLKEENKAFDVKKYEHSYPHCWRTDKPVLYYPLDSWFIKTTAIKDKLVALNKTINWKPESTGTGRFGNWLENLVDWNLSRSRYWGTPLPIWRTEDGSEEICIGSVGELNSKIDEAAQAGFMPEGFRLKDMHRPFVDDVVLVSSKGEKMFREPDLIDVWFDSGAMPYAQWHYPFENQEEFAKAYPADFIAEGVDQTRGWFFTLHTIAALLSECSPEIKAVNFENGNQGIAFKNVISNGLVLDKNGNKMSKRLGNAVDPFSTIEQYSADATRWYMISNASPWDNLKFNIEGLDEVRRKFFGTLYNTYAFFALYANIDGFKYSEADIDISKRPEIDRWIISLLNTLTKEVDEFYEDFEPTKAARSIQNFVDEHLSNWFVRLSRRRFWKGDYSEDKISAYQTLYTCLETVAKLMSPIAPFFSDRLFNDLNSETDREKVESVHLADFPIYHEELVDKSLEERMQLAQDISSMVLSLRKKVGINVRQPLNKILLPVLDAAFQAKVEKVKELILSETNIKEIEYITDTAGIIKKKIKPNFKSLGPKVGKNMKAVGNYLTNLTDEQINSFETNRNIVFDVDGLTFDIPVEDVEIIAEDVPGWQVTNIGRLTVALDVTITEELKEEGIAREVINRIQNLRKDKGFEVTDKIKVLLEDNSLISKSVEKNKLYICAETLSEEFEILKLTEGDSIEIENEKLFILLSKI
ncbi:Isoleucyl-tRNA synthetase [Pseudopedobacter saltans DSM 12145]|uniref:Isoleucine--tRNA ligase n=1 Tax=Pseudopedobacter saltans (strain ATCC 51119 / DSM 12145 / JCM 21818 / CCUG 39354 / LMG 10337 / NBRC 100064 / NCIMB 13643) TaxID=762903 RepID=F0S4R9_PSESL|nr:isoleucine--tRNA ligase [Pseudopedobacter saltans]ADY53087.1 Isoleucyl-tRNA synthetase [Pseudopedobacter saltans DSM 12145]